MKSKFTAKLLLDEGGSASFYKLKESKTLGFKEFHTKAQAEYAYKIQKKLAKLGLSPKVYGKIQRISFENWHELTGWGYLTQLVSIKSKLSRKKIQQLVDNIRKKTKLSFWDCHEYNIGVYRNKYLCIDTGKESFDANCNSWGLDNPGPICDSCNKYICKCNDEWSF